MSFLTTAVSNSRGLQPKLRLDFTKGGAIDPRLLVSYSGLLSIFDSAGNLQSVPQANHALNRDPVTGEYSLDIWPGSTNLVRSSGNLTNASFYGIEKLSAEVSDALNPDGTVGYVFRDTAVNGRHIIFQLPSGVTGARTISVWVRPATLNPRQWVMLRGGGTAYFDIINGTLGTPGAGVSATIEARPNGWWKISMSASNTSAESFLFMLATADNQGGEPTYIGNGSGVQVWGAQVELLPFATPYIPTTTAAASRGGMNVQINGTNLQNIYGPSGNTIIVEADIPVADNDTFIFNQRNVTSNHNFQLYRYPGNGMLVSTYTGSSYFINAGGFSTGRARVAIRRQPGSYRASLNGGTVVADNRSYDPASPTNWYFGSVSGAPPSPVKLRKVLSFPGYLSDAQLQNMSAL